MRILCGTILGGGGCGRMRETMRRSARESGGFYGVTMLSDGNRARKSSAFRVIRPSLACARAPIITSATGRRAALPDRLRWMCLFHAAAAMERSSSLTPGGRSIPISNRKFRSRASSPRKAGESSTYVRGDIISPSSAWRSIASADAMPNTGSRSSTSRMTQVSTTMLTAVLPREVLPSTLQWYAASEKSMHIQALPWRLYAAASAQSLLRRYRDPVLCSRAGSSPESFACTRGFGRVSKPAHVRLLVSPRFSCCV